MKDQLRIGFAQQFFTLWSVREDPKYQSDSFGNHIQVGITTYYTYHQNLSVSKEKAVDKARHMGCVDLNVDESLKGKTNSWQSYMETIDEFRFRFGKYKYDDIRKSDDQGYVLWYANETKNQYAIDRALELNPDYVLYDEYLILKELADEYTQRDCMIENAKSAGEITGIMNRNITDEYLFLDGLNIRVDNLSLKWMEYNGFSYALPVINGKAKRVKGKTVKVLFEEKQDDLWAKEIQIV